MALARYTRAIYHLLEVSQVLASVSTLWRYTRALFSLATFIFCVVFIFSGFLFLISGAIVFGFQIGVMLLLFGRCLLDFECRGQLTLLHQTLL